MLEDKKIFRMVFVLDKKGQGIEKDTLCVRLLMDPGDDPSCATKPPSTELSIASVQMTEKNPTNISCLLKDEMIKLSGIKEGERVELVITLKEILDRGLGGRGITIGVGTPMAEKKHS